MSYADEMAARLPQTIHLPVEFRALFDWIEAQGFFMASGRYPGDRLGLLWPEGGDMLGTIVLFRVETQEQAMESGQAWFGDKVANVESRLVPFARTGGDGSYVGFWVDDDGKQHIVHLGSEGEVGVLVGNPLDFLRLLAIGYEEISGDCLYAPGEPPDDQGGERIVDNPGYRSWLIETFGTSVPAVASEIMLPMTDGMAESSTDPFWTWVRRHQDW